MRRALCHGFDLFCKTVAQVKPRALRLHPARFAFAEIKAIAERVEQVRGGRPEQAGVFAGSVVLGLFLDQGGKAHQPLHRIAHLMGEIVEIIPFVAQAGVFVMLSAQFPRLKNQ